MVRKYGALNSFRTFLDTLRGKGTRYIYIGDRESWEALTDEERDQYEIAELSDDGELAEKQLPYNKRWLQFDPDNRKGLVIKAGACVRFHDADTDKDIVKWYSTDKKVDLSDTTLINGAAYALVAKVGEEEIEYSAVLQNSADKGATVGWFHTLCAAVPSSQKAIYRGSSATVDCVVGYDSVKEKPYYDFYHKTGTYTVTTYYGTIEVAHPLAGFAAGDILPESVWCLDFRPTCDPAGMIYSKEANRAVDIYIMSGTGTNTRSEYDKAPTRNRVYEQMIRDLGSVGKQCLDDAEFSAIALGSPTNCSVSTGADSSKLPTTGGNVSDQLSSYTSQRGARMVSGVGCEDCCGYLWQVLRDTGPNGSYGWNNLGKITYRWGDTETAGTDDKYTFGGEYGVPYQMLAGADFYVASAIAPACCGPFSRAVTRLRSNAYVGAYVHDSSRGSSHICP